jgi:dihydrofolate reductase
MLRPSTVIHSLAAQSLTTRRRSGTVSAMKQEIHLIAAVAQNGVIGSNNGLPWHLPGDLKRFKALTMDKAVIFGRTTWEGIHRPLPGRHVIVLSNNPGYTPGHDAQVVENAEAALTLAAQLAPGQPVMVCGGEQIYRLFLPLATQLDLTRINADFDGDTHFPAFAEEGWQVINAEEHHEHEPGYTYLTYRRR